MIFKKRAVILLSCFFICSCGLQLGEVTPGAPEYYLSRSSNVCSQLNYKQVFMNYFFNNKPSRGKVSQALTCISIKVKEFRDLIKHEFLNKQETINILNQEFLQVGNMKPIVDNILKPDYFYDYVSITNNLFDLVQPNLKRNYLKADWICQIKSNDENIISKRSADILISVLEDLSQMFSSVEIDALNISKDFFIKKNIGKFELQTSSQALIEFSAFLSDYLIEILPSYAQFLKDQIDKTVGKQLFENTIYINEATFEINQQEDKDTALRAVMEPLLSLLDLPQSSGDKVRPKNLKYLLLNIYTMKAFFKAYDLNQDFYLSPQELKSLSCLMTPLVSVLVSPQLKEEWNIVQKAYDPRAIGNYIINYQNFPSQELDMLNSNFWRFLWFRIRKANELYGQSYIEVSRLFSLLFVEFFNKIQFEEL